MIIIKTNISNLVCTTCFWNNLHPILSKSNISKAKLLFFNLRAITYFKIFIRTCLTVFGKYITFQFKDDIYKYVFLKISISIISEVVLYENYLIYEGLLNQQLLHHDHYMLCFIESYTIRVDAKRGSCKNLNLLHVLVSSVIMLLRSFDLITSNNL